MRAKTISMVSLLILSQLVAMMLGGAVGDHPREIELVDEVLTYETLVLIPPGEDFFVAFDPSRGELIPKDIPPLEAPCLEAIELVPEWMRMNLTHKFRLLSGLDRIAMANLILNSPNESYRDEIGFVIAHSTPETLTDDDFFPQIITHNAQLIYEHEKLLDYVRIMEKDDHTTLSYRQSDDSWVELSRDDYYWFVVHPKLGDELPTYIDPNYDYTSDPPFDRNHGVAPPTGKYWREWFFEYNKTGKPLLLDQLRGMNTTLDAIRAINGWIGASMVFTSDNERPVQPVRIYVKGQGRCGEYQDMRSAAARAALIPVIATSNPAEDHVWNEFWDLGWHHWDGMIDNPHAYEKGWGKTLSSVWNSRGDGYAWSVTSRYSETAVFDIIVDDSSFMPVDGAEVSVYTENFYQPEIRSETFGSVTDSNGRVSIELGDLRNYWGRADTSDLGSDPTNPISQNEMAMNTTAGEEYDIHFRVPRSAPSLMVGVSGHRPLPSENDDPIFSIDFEVVGQITRGDARVAPGRYDLYKEGGNIDFFITNELHMAAYHNDLPVTGWEFHQRTTAQNVSYRVASNLTWFYVLSNGFSQQTYKIVKLKAAVMTETYINIETPIEGQRISFGEIFDISGIVMTSMVEPLVEISLDNGHNWRPSTVETAENGTYRYTTTMSIIPADPAKITNLPMEGRIMARIAGKNGTIVSSSILWVDDIDPEIQGELDRSVVHQGDVIVVKGRIWDNMAVESAYYSIDSSGGGRRLDLVNGTEYEMEVSTAGMTPGIHQIWISAEDLYENHARMNLTFKILEGDPPRIEILSPGTLTVHRYGGPIEVKGRVRDNSAIGQLWISLGNMRADEFDVDMIDDQGYFTHTIDYSTSSLDEGEQDLAISAVDTAYNLAEEVRTIILDGERPKMELDNSENMVVAPNTDLEISGMLRDDHGIGYVEAIVNEADSQEVRLNRGSGTFSLELDSNFDLNEGENIVLFRGYDSVGWMVEEEIRITVDGKAPTLDFEESPSYVMKGDMLDLRMLIDDDGEIASIVLLISGSGEIDITDHLDVAELDFAIDTGDMRTGLSDVTVRATDAAGNIATGSISVNVITDSLDSDNDGVPDWWEYLYWLNPFFFDSDLDPDEDGFTNLEEFLGNDRAWGEEDDSTDPRDTLSRPREIPSGASIAIFVILIIVFMVIILTVLLVLGLIFSRKRKVQYTS